MRPSIGVAVNDARGQATTWRFTFQLNPFGQTGARIMTTLLNGLEDSGGRYGLESMCVGGGQGMAMVVERL